MGLVIRCLSFICERKFYARTHVKITRHWKSTQKEARAREQRAQLIKFLVERFLYNCDV